MPRPNVRPVVRHEIIAKKILSQKVIPKILTMMKKTLLHPQVMIAEAVIDSIAMIARAAIETVTATVIVDREKNANQY
jgi:hypothetical protein